MEPLSNVWKLIAFRGLLAIAFGVLAFAMPSLTIAVLVLVFGIYALADGLVTIAAGSRAGVRRQAWLLWLEGVAGVALGLCALLVTSLTMIVLVEILGAWAILTGVLEIAAALRLRGEPGSELFFLLAGAASLVVGAVMIAFPTFAAVAIVFLLGLYALAFGAAMLLFALRIRRVARTVLAHA